MMVMANAKPMRLIFLDIDGVLNDAKTTEKVETYRGIDPKKAERLAHICKQTSAHLVLISSWKAFWFSHNKEKQDCLANYLDETLARYGVRVAAKVLDEECSRGADILRYLKYLEGKGILVSSFVILDNEPWDYEECGLSSRLVRTSFERGGLTDELAKQAIKLLSL